MVMQDPYNVREAVSPRLNEALHIVGRQLDVLEILRPRLQDCTQPSPEQLASNRAHQQGDSRLLRSIIAALSDSIPQLDVAADILTSTLKHALDSGAARDALPFLGHGQSHDEIAGHLLAHPRVMHATFDPQRFHVSINVAISLLRLLIDYYIDQCAHTLRCLGIPDRTLLPIDHRIVKARAYLEQALLLIHAALSHIIDAIYGAADR